MKRRAWLSCLLALAMLLSCFAVITVSVSAAGAEYPNDEAAIEAGYVFCVNEKYYRTLADAYQDVPENGTIYMLADYTNSTGCEWIGWDSEGVKTFTIEGGEHTYSSDKNHPLHFCNCNVTINQMNLKTTGDNVSGPRVESTSKVLLQNSTWEKSGAASRDWHTAVIVYGTLTLGEGAVLKSPYKHGVWLEGKSQTADRMDQSDSTVIPHLILKANAIIDAKNYSFFEATKSEIEILAYTVTLTDSYTEGEHTGSYRYSNSGSTVTMAGPTDAEYSIPEAKAGWKDLYTKLGETWFDTPNVDKETILSYKPDMGAASVRMKEDSYGLRFGTTISADVVNFAKALVERGTMTSFSYGTLIVRYDDIRDRTDLSAEALTAAGVKFIDVKADKGLKENKDGSVSLSTAMVNIKEANYGVKFCAISYITYVYADTTLGTVTAYADPSEASSIADAAWRALADVTENLNSENTNPLHSYWKLENGEYVEVDGDVYTKYSKAQRETLLAFTSLN